MEAAPPPSKAECWFGRWLAFGLRLLCAFNATSITKISTCWDLLPDVVGVVSTLPTDLVSKSAALRIKVGGVPVTVGGMCKGSGMIHPNMATMLGVVTCDAAVAPAAWRDMVRRASISSFNQITVSFTLCHTLCWVGSDSWGLNADMPSVNGNG